MSVIPMKRAVEAEEIAAAAVFLASDNARSINGDTIAIDGGSLTRGYPALLTGLKKAVMIAAGRYTSGRIAIANLSSSIESLELRRVEGATFEDLVALSNLLFLRGDLLGRIADHDRAERVANEAVAASPDTARALYIRARLAERFHCFQEAHALLDEALAAGHPEREIDATRAALFQATGKYSEALVLRERLADDDRGIHTLGALASLLAEMDQWAAAESCYAAALDADDQRPPSALRPTAVRIGRERDAPRRSAPCGGALRRARRDSAGARSGPRTSR